MDALFDALQDFDIASILPELEGFLGSLRFWCGFAALLGPALLLLFGLMILKNPDAGINRYLGFRVCRKNASEATRSRTMRMAGTYWTILGGILAAVTLLTLVFTLGADALGMLTATAICLLAQLVGLLVVAILLKKA